jgi:hypothetical protein
MYWPSSHLFAIPEFFKGNKIKGFPLELYRVVEIRNWMLNNFMHKPIMSRSVQVCTEYIAHRRRSFDVMRMYVFNIILHRKGRK